MYRRVNVSVQPEDLAQYDEWCRENRLPRGAAMGALVRLVRSLSRELDARPVAPVVQQLAGRPGGRASAPPGERVYEPDPVEPT